MKRTLTMLLLVAAFPVLAQPFNDAVQLLQYTDQGKFKWDDKEKIWSIVGQYYEPVDPTEEAIYDALTANPFFETIVPGRSRNDLKTDEVSIPTIDPGSAIKSFGNLNVTNLADGLAKFLVTRAKQELSIAFFQKFQEQLAQERELQLLFPATHKNLTLIGEEIYNFSGYLDMLREGFEKDLTEILTNAKNLVDDPVMDQLFQGNPQLEVMLSDGLYLAIQLKEGKHVGDALNSYIDEEASIQDLGQIDPNIYPSVVSLNIFSQSLKSDGEGYWVSAKDFKPLLINDHLGLRIYLGLIYQQVLSFEREKEVALEFGAAGNRQGLTDLLKVAAKLDQEGRTFRQELLDNLQTLTDKGTAVTDQFNLIRQLNIAPGTKPTHEHYLTLYNASIDFVESAQGVYDVYKPYISNAPDVDVLGYLGLARSAGDIYADVSSRQYASAISNTAAFLQQVFDQFPDVAIFAQVEGYVDAIGRMDLKKLKVGEIITALQGLEQRYAIPVNYQISATLHASDQKKIVKKDIAAFVDNLETSDLKEKYAQLLAFIRKYGNFMATVAKAESSAEVQQAIESIALPVGSYSIKRRSEKNIALQAYVGLSPGVELEDFSDPSFVFGVNAPVGVAFSKGRYEKPARTGQPYKEKGSCTWFLTLIDIGALSAFRFGDDETASVPEVSLANIFAPGIYHVWGLPKVPLSIGAGAQMGPALREVTSEEATVGSATVVSAKVFIAVDIPLINFHTKPR